MADFTIKKHGDFTLRWTLSVDAVAIDTADYSFVCKVRDAIVPTGYPDPSYIPGGEITLTTAVVAGEASKLDTSLTDIQTATLTATKDAAAVSLPLIDVELTHTASGTISFTDSYTVAIADTQSYD